MANQSSLQRKITMQARHLCWSPYFFPRRRGASSQFFHSRIATANLLVSVGQTTRQRSNYFDVNEAISMIEYRAPTYWFQLAMVSFTAYCVFSTYYTFFRLRIWGPPKSWGPWL